VRRFRGFHFPNRESFLYLEDQYSAYQFRDRLVKSLIETNTAYGKALAGLEARGGWIRAKEFPIATGGPVKPAKGHTPHQLIEEKLLKLELIVRESRAEGDIFRVFSAEPPTPKRRAQIIAENIFLSALKTWLIKMGWSSTNTLDSRDGEKIPLLGQFAFDLVGAAYLSSMVQYKGGKLLSGFIVGDVLFGETVTLPMLQAFLTKWDILLGQKRVQRLQPAFFAETFAPDALRMLRKRGCMIGTPLVLFGEEAARNLQQLVKTIEKAAEAVAKDPDAVFELLKRMSKFEGAAKNLRGVVLEMFIARLYSLRGYGIDIRKRVWTNGEQAEIDVRAQNMREVVCCECKAKGPKNLVSGEEISKWYKNSCSRIRAWLKEHDPDKDRRMEFYSSTGYTDDAVEVIQNIRRQESRPIEFFDGRDILKMLHDSRQTALVDIFNEQFVG